MIGKTIVHCLFPLLFLLSGCVFNISLIPPSSPLEEVVVEGKGQAKILLLDVNGFISERERSRGLGARRDPSVVQQLREALQKAEADKDIVGMIIKINSPGGTVTASDIVFHELTRFKERKGIPVYACILTIGASGGYLIASASDKIIAHPTAIMGNIGVIAIKFNLEGLLEKVGVQEETYTSGEKKDALSPFRPTAPEEREMLQSIINQLHGRFVDAVYSQRNSLLSRAELERVSDGRIFTADQAFEAKLIDSVGYLDDTIETMKDSLDIQDARIISYYRAGEFKGTIYSAYPDNPSLLLNLIGENADSLVPFFGVEFLYLWNP